MNTEYTEKYHPIPQPDEIPIREKEDAMGAYLMMFAALAAGLPLPIINLIAAIIYYFVNKSKSRFVHFHSLQSLISQLPTSLLNAGLVFWVIRIWMGNYEVNDYFRGYLGLVAVGNIIYFIFSIIAAVRARRGQFYYFLFFGKLAFHSVYKMRNNEEPGDKPKYINKPPI